MQLVPTIHSFSQTPVKLPVWIATFGLGFVLFYSLVKLPWYDGTKHLDTIMMLLGVVCIIKFAPTTIRASLPMWALLAAVMATILTWVSGQITHPELIAAKPKIEHLGNHFLFLVLAFWLMGSKTKTFLVWGIAFATVVASPWVLGGGWAELQAGWRGQRIDLGIHNAQHTALVFGTALLGWLVFGRRMIVGKSAAPIRALVWAAVAALLVFVIAASQTRATFIALAAVVMVVFLWLLVKGMQSSHKKTYFLIAGLLVLLAASIWVVKEDSIRARFATEAPVLAKLVEGDLVGVPTTSFGYRVHSWRAGFEWIAKYPVFGVGRNGGEIVMKHTEWLQAYTGGQFGHMHSSYMEFAVRYGFFGLTIYIVLFVWTARKAHQTWQAGAMPTDVYVFSLLFVVFYGVVNTVESFMFYNTGRLPFTMVMAGLLGFIWRHQMNRQSS